MLLLQFLLNEWARELNSISYAEKRSYQVREEEGEAILGSCVSDACWLAVLFSLQNKLAMATFRQTESYLSPFMRQLKRKV